jgi:hypothetical protein
MVGGVKCRETRGETHLISTEVQQDLPCGWSRCYLRSGGLVAAEVGQCESGSVTTAVWHQRQAEQRGSNVSVGRARVFSSVWQRAGISARGYQRSPWKAGRAAASSRRDMDDVFYVPAGGFSICSWSEGVVSAEWPVCSPSRHWPSPLTHQDAAWDATILTRPSNDKLGVCCLKKGALPIGFASRPHPIEDRTVLSSREPPCAQISIK